MKLTKGVGIFIWRMNAIEGGRPSHIIAKCNQYGIKHILVKYADGRTPYFKYNKEADIAELVSLGKAKDVDVWGWVYTYGNYPQEEAKVTAEYYNKFGFTGLVVDAEQEYKNQPARAAEYMKTLRQLLKKGQVTIGLSSYGIPSYHASFPWEQFVAECDFIMPQVYFAAFATGGLDNPDVAISKAMSDCARIAPNKPVIITIGESANVNFTPDKIRLAVKIMLEKYNMTTFNVWEWQTIKSDVWPVLAEAAKNIDSKLAAPQPPPAPSQPASPQQPPQSPPAPVELPADVSAWAAEAWQWATKEKLIDGKNPKDPVTREQLITILYRYYEKFK